MKKILFVLMPLLLSGCGEAQKPAAPAYRVKGPAAAPIRITEFTDFECPACAAANETMRKVLRVYGDNIRIEFRHFPWPFHKLARKAAVAAECAGQQGKFWEYADKLFKCQAVWSSTAAAGGLQGAALNFEKLAKESALDIAAFKKCADGASAYEAVLADIKEGETIKLEATPTFFINGKKITGYRSLAEETIQFDEIIRGKTKK